MDDVIFQCGDAPLTALALVGRERLGEVSSFDLELIAPEPVDPSAVLGKPAVVRLTSPFGERAVHGMVARFVVVATSNAGSARRYKATLRSAMHLLTLRRRTRVYQHLTAPDIVKLVFKDAGFPADHVVFQLTGKHAEREYVTQYSETDATFIRRICEEDGLYFRFEPRDGFDAAVFEDGSEHAPPAHGEPLLLVDETHLITEKPAAFACESARRRRPGRVTLRDYDPERPALHLEGVKESGAGTETGTEVYRAPGRFKTPAEGEARAQALLESLRAEAKTFRFQTTLGALAPGLSIEMECAPDYPGTARPEGKLFVIEVSHEWRKDTPRIATRVATIPLSTPYRLPMATPRPKLSGVHSALVTGAAGEEIHTDAEGRIKVRFHWDPSGPVDDKSSLPVRVVQPNTPGSMVIPRVGWEVIVAFEDGDPDRPYVLGRTYNAKCPPPFALPANKTITALATVSSPGGARPNAMHYDDAAGRQHMVWAAGFAKTTVVANNMLTQTVGFEARTVTGDQTWTIGSNESVSVKNAMIVDVGSQTASVGTTQSLMIKAAGNTAVGSEAVVVGGALLEQVGNPVAGAKGFAQAAALAGVGSIPVVGDALAKGYSFGKAVAEAYSKGGMDAALMAAGQQAVSLAAEQVGGADAIVAGADAMGITPWSDKAQAAKAAAAEAGGGTGGAAAAAAGAAEAAPGHRKTIVDGIMTESIGAAYTVTTPGSIKWSTLGASNFAIGGSHTTRAVKCSRLTGGISSDAAASVTIKTKLVIARTISGISKTSIAGSLNSTAGSSHDIKAGGNLTIKVGGSMKVSGGAVVFACGDSIVAAHGGGVLIKASTVTINGKAVQSGKATNS